MASSNNSQYDQLINKITFGKLLENALNSLSVSEEKLKTISSFVDDQAKDLYKYNYDNYQLISDDEQFQDKTINEFAGLNDLDESKEFIKTNKHLICQQTIDYLKTWSINMEINCDFIGMERIVNQLMIVVLIHQLIHKLNLDVAQSIQLFFTRIKSDDKQYKENFDEERDLLRDSLRDDAEKQNSNFDQQDEEKGQEKHLENLDPIEVLKSLPKVLLECLKSRNVKQLQEVLLTMSREEADQQVHRCIKSGLLVLVQNAMDAKGDEEDEIKNDE